jgi:hypothetical protein
LFDAVSVIAGDGDVDGDGLGCVETVVFVLLGPGVQPVVSKITNHASMKRRRIMVILIELPVSDGATSVPSAESVFTQVF